MASCRNLAAALAIGGLLVACKNDRQPQPAERPGESSQAPGSTAHPVTITASDFKFEMPDTIPAGVVTFNLVNHGKEIHHAQLLKLEDGKTMDDLSAAMKEHGPPPSWMKHVGGPNPAGPGQTISGASALAPGNYVVICFIPSTDGQPACGQGHGASVYRQRYRYRGGGAAAGRRHHPAGGLRLPALAAVDRRVAHLPGGERRPPAPRARARQACDPAKRSRTSRHGPRTLKGPPPAAPVGGVAGLDKGLTAQFTADLTPGEYGFICFVPDAKDGKPHLAHGMMKQFKVES